MNNNNEIIIYTTEDGKTKIDLKIKDDNCWLNQKEIVELYNSTKSNISEHIKNIFKDGELKEEQTVRKFRTVQQEGNKQVEREIEYYNLDMILAIGYRIRNIRGIQFRNWASNKLKDYLIKGFVLDDEKLKNFGGGDYWKELLDKIRDIRSSEKVLYKQVLDLYATSIDYDSKSETTLKFFKIIQNKFHYASSGKTASEIIYERADAKKDFMGLTSFKGNLPTKQDIKIAKNYLTKTELKVLNNLVSGYFDFAEIQAIEHKKMYMKDYLKQLDNLLKTMDKKILTDNSNIKISHQQALNKAEEEYKKYQNKTLSQVEIDYLKNIKELENKIKKINKKEKK